LKPGGVHPLLGFVAFLYIYLWRTFGIFFYNKYILNVENKANFKAFFSLISPSYINLLKLSFERHAIYYFDSNTLSKF